MAGLCVGCSECRGSAGEGKETVALKESTVCEGEMGGRSRWETGSGKTLWIRVNWTTS